MGERGRVVGEREHERKGMEESEKKVGREGWRVRQKW